MREELTKDHLHVPISVLGFLPMERIAPPILLRTLQLVCIW